MRQRAGLLPEYSAQQLVLHGINCGYCIMLKGMRARFKISVFKIPELRLLYVYSVIT